MKIKLLPVGCMPLLGRARTEAHLTPITLLAPKLLFVDHVQSSVFAVYFILKDFARKIPLTDAPLPALGHYTLTLLKLKN